MSSVRGQRRSCTPPPEPNSSRRRSSHCSTSGTWVLLDRFVDSSLAYQGGGRELGVEAVREINRFGTEGLAPDRTLLLVLDPTARPFTLT